MFSVKNQILGTTTNLNALDLTGPTKLTKEAPPERPIIQNFIVLKLDLGRKKKIFDGCKGLFFGFCLQHL